LIRPATTQCLFAPVLPMVDTGWLGLVSPGKATTFDVYTVTWF